MRLALDEAGQAVRGGDVPVGAVVLSPDGTTVLATGHNEREATGDPTAHAEVLALRRAAAALRSSAAAPGNSTAVLGNSAAPSSAGEGAGGRRAGEWRLTGCTLVVTLEPCTMCAGALVQSRVDRLVYGARDEKAGAAGSLWDVVRDRRLNHRPEVVEGVLAEESARLLTEFFRDR
ncbi:nucleoside deaminase [Streptomyces sp. NPDC005917]|uniref:nucleoside deaminase n=1 Tax=unclassified Streptomyces TaxID=2593676 RepID=UPI0033FFC91E